MWVKPLLIIPRPYIGQVESLESAQREMVKEGKELVERTRQLLTRAGFKVNTDVEEGNPRIAIIDYAARWRADLILMGSHGRKGLDRFLIGRRFSAMLIVLSKSCALQECDLLTAGPRRLHRDTHSAPSD